MFNQQELQIIVGGVNAPIDLDDLRENCNYGGLYDDNEDTIRMFWKACLSLGMVYTTPYLPLFDRW
jgi:ubiquitin-protein ligase E3 C